MRIHAQHEGDLPPGWDPKCKDCGETHPKKLMLALTDTTPLQHEVKCIECYLKKVLAPTSEHWKGVI